MGRRMFRRISTRELYKQSEMTVDHISVVRVFLLHLVNSAQAEVQVTEMFFWLTITVLLKLAIALLHDVDDEECVDRSPYCSTNDCTVRPGYALEYCKKTCGNCEPFCHNSHFVSCKESRKPECDSMLKDYCPLLCGACRPVKRKTKKDSRAPLSIANLQILHKFSKPRNRTEAQLQTVNTVLVIPASTEKPDATTTLAEDGLIFRAPSQEEDIYPKALPDNAAPTSMPIMVEDYEYDYENDYETNSVSADSSKANISLAENQIFPPEPVRITSSRQKNYRPPPPVPLQRLSYNSRPACLYHQATRRQYHSGYPDSEWLLPYPQNPQAYPVRALTNPAHRRYTAGFHGLPSFASRLQGPHEPTMGIGDLVTLLGCHDKDPSICSKVTELICLSRPGYYLKLCPVKCKNCSGLQCLDSIKIDCIEAQRLGGCKLPAAADYCPKTCRMCALPAAIAKSLPPCKDELETCGNLAESGICEHPYSRNALRTYCAKSCGFCRDPQYYMNDMLYRRFLKAKEKKQPKKPLG